MLIRTPRQTSALIGTTRQLPTLLTIPDAADELSTSVSGIYELIRLGLLDLVKLGSKRSRITGESIARLAARRDKPSDDVANLKQFKKQPA